MNPKFSFSRLALAIALFLCLVSPAIAQGTTGDIVGRVVDSTGEPGVGNRFHLSPATSSGAFLQPVSLFGPGFGPPVGRPMTLQLGARLTF